MPTPVSAARQCLTEEAARALDDAVAVARRRKHAQTTSLHAISALLALPSSALRDACSRARSCSYSPRLQFRALELSVGFSLDRLPTSKALEEEPLVSNSLMAAIKRSQANQRRHPESFHLLQMHSQQQQTASFLKVELKHFILSILDDPIVSRVFGEAGIRSCDIKLALLQPPAVRASRFYQSRCPPIFLCNLPGSKMTRPGFNFPFMGDPLNEDGDENCRRIGEVLVRKMKRNPLLIGVYARSALRSFTESVKRGRRGMLPAEIAGLSIICIGKEISEFVTQVGSEENMGSKFKDLGHAVEQCSGPGIAVNFGEIELFVGNSISGAAAKFVVSQLTSLLEIHGAKLWLVGVAETSDTYSKFLALFPNAEKDWDLHLLPMTTATPSVDGLYSKSSLMGSFVPFGGFFSMPSDAKNPLRCASQSFYRCSTCNGKYEQEVADIMKTNEEQSSLHSRIFGLQKKWSDICQNLHLTRPLPELNISPTKSQVSSAGDIRYGSVFKESSSKDPSLYEIQHTNHSVCMPKELHSTYPSKQILPMPVSSDTASVNTNADQVAKFSKSQRIDLQGPWLDPSPKADTRQFDPRSTSSFTSVTTDLGLGLLYTSADQEPETPKRLDHRERLQHLSNSLSTDFEAMHQNTSYQIAQSSACSISNLEQKFKSADLKSLNQLLTEKVGWQDDVIYAISQTLLLCRTGVGKHRSSHVRGDLWLAFLGPDRVGKKKIASALAEMIFGKESLISVDLSSHDGNDPLNSLFECHISYCYDVVGRKTVVDYIAGQLSKKPHAVVFLENVDKADSLVQTCLLQAIRTGKFPDSHGREISIGNTIFIVTSTISKGSGAFLLERETSMFTEEKILEAKKFQLQMIVGHISEDAKSSGINVKVVPRKGVPLPTFPNKRKLVESSDSTGQTKCKIQKQDPVVSRSCLDLNMPLEGAEEDNDFSATESLARNAEVWLNDFYSEIDEKVAFKPFNFDGLAEKILKLVTVFFQRTFGSEVVLEIDYEVMVQILAAAWISDEKNAVEHWVENVLGRSFIEAQQKYQPATQYAIKLITCGNIFVENQAPGVCLPPRIDLK